jgi:hypothetical protein
MANSTRAGVKCIAEVSMEKSQLWLQTEKAFPIFRAFNKGSAAEKALAVDVANDLMGKVLSPLLRQRLDLMIRKYKNDKIIGAM